MTPEPESDEAPSTPAEPAEEAPAIPAPARPPSRGSDLAAFLRRRWQTVSAIGLLALGIVLVMLGWYGAAHTNILTEQIPYLISGGLLGLGLIIVAGFIAYGAGAERRSDDLEHALARLVREGASFEPRAGDAATSPANGRVYTVPGGRSFHLAGCPIVEGKEGVRELDEGEAARAGLAPCKLCGPG